MRRLLVLGAGQSATYLIRFLLERAAERDWTVAVADRDPALAAAALAGHPRGEALGLDADDAGARAVAIAEADLTLCLLPPSYQYAVARDCVDRGSHMISVSYQDPRLADLDAEAQRQGLLLLSEIGLDPGIDLMSTMELVRRVTDRGGVVESYESYGGGIPAPEVDANPLRYCITWNPRNIVMAGEKGAQYLEQGKIKLVPWHELFHHTWPRPVDGFGLLEAYPNRDSLVYRDRFGLTDAHTLIRGTLRYPGWCETWHQVVRLGLPNLTLPIPDLARRSWAEIVEMFLPRSAAAGSLESRVASHLGISRTGGILRNLEWLGLFSTEPTGAPGTTAADALVALLQRRLPLPEGGRDAVVLHHELIARYPNEGDRREHLASTLVHYGEPGGATAMNQTVGLPTGIAAELLLAGELDLDGCRTPTEPAIYEPILARLRAAGLDFRDKTEALV